MKHLTSIVALAAFLLLSACGASVDYEAVKTYQDPGLPPPDLVVSDSTRVLLVFPHADDEMTVAGLVSQWVEAGAQVHLLTLGEATRDAGQRLAELDCAVERLGLAGLSTARLPGNDWDAVLSDSIVYWYDHREEIKARIAQEVAALRPHVLVTYDAEIGGYGHPEHRISAELAQEIFEESRADSSSVLAFLFQMTLTDALEEFLVGGREAYGLALARTGSAGLPAPEVAVDIRPYWPLKNAAGHCYASQAKTLRKFHLICAEEDLPLHSAAFSHEYYKVLRR